MFTRALAAVESAFTRVAANKRVAILMAGLLPLIARTLLLPILPIPRPAVQDEFSYLLSSDTFASGRLANPTPAFSEHFETPQVLMRPTYASKYPPLSGLTMALGQKLTGQPWVGVWLSMGVLCAVICWALQGWLPAVWALAGSLIAVLHIGIVSYWTESYWGGTCAAIGGALLVGALPRLTGREFIERTRLGPTLAFAVGLAVLANTRPFEGLVFALVCSGWLLFEWRRERVAVSAVVRRAALPIAVLLIPVAAWMAYYNFRVTGNALELPYVAHDSQYALLEPVLWQTHVRPEPVYSSASLRNFWLADLHEKQKAHHQILAAHFWDFLLVVRFFVGWPLAACMVAVPWPLWRDPVARAALVLGALAYVGPALDTRVWPHYAAAETVLIYIVAACALRALRNAWPGVDGVYLMWGALVVFAVPTLLWLLTPGNRFLIGSEAFLTDVKHATVEEQLERKPGQHLVLVRYGRGHDLYEELVYNRADMDASKVVWARSLGAEKDQELIRHYSNRDVWMLEEDAGVRLSRASPVPAQAPSSYRSSLLATK